MNLNARRIKSVRDQFVPHVGRHHHHSSELLVETNFLLLIEITDQADGKAATSISCDKRAARHKTIKARWTTANLAAAVKIFVTPHAVDVVVMHHPHQRNAALDQGGDD